MTQPPGHYGPPGGYGDQYGQPGGGYGDPYGQPSGPPGGYGQPSGPPGYDPYGQPSGPPAGYGQPSGPPGYDQYGQPGGTPGYGPPGGGYGPGGYPPGAGMPPPTFPPPGAPKKSNTGLVVGLSISGLVLLLCMGLGLFFFFNSSSTGSPTTSVEGFLNAARDQNSAAASAYICQKLKDAGNTNGIGGNDFGETESEVTLELSWSNVTEVSNDGQNAEVTADIDATVTIDGQSTSNSGIWTFKLVNEDGWKICEFDLPT